MGVICTRSAEVFGAKLAAFLNLPLFRADVHSFACGEIHVSVPEMFDKVVVVASTVTNNDWIELFLLLDALRDARFITLCLTYVGYSRQDKDICCASRGGRLFLDMLKKSNVTQCIFVDIHNEDDLKGIAHCCPAEVFALDITKRFGTNGVVIVSPDAGGEKRARRVAELVGVDCTVGHKQRLNTVTNVQFSSDVKDKICILIDDIVDSGTTLYSSSTALLEAGGSRVIAYATHRVLSGDSVNLLANSGILEINLTDSIEVKQKLPIKFSEISIVPLIASAIKCIM